MNDVKPPNLNCQYNYLRPLYQHLSVSSMLPSQSDHFKTVTKVKCTFNEVISWNNHVVTSWNMKFLFHYWVVWLRKQVWFCFSLNQFLEVSEVVRVTAACGLNIARHYAQQTNKQKSQQGEEVQLHQQPSRLLANILRRGDEIYRAHYSGGQSILHVSEVSPSVVVMLPKCCFFTFYCRSLSHRWLCSI